MLDVIKNQSEVVGEIKKLGHSNFKVALKTKDEPELIEKWILHYSKIFGPENIIIFDNLSTDDFVLDIYSKYSDELGGIFSFDHKVKPKMNHNSIHLPSLFPELYKAISSVCDYFSIFDTDEFFVCIKNGKWCSGGEAYKSLIKYSEELEGKKAILCYWLNNYPESDSHFYVGRSFEKFKKGLGNGKPFLPAKAVIEMPVNHNKLISDKNLYPDVLPRNFYLLHLQSFTKTRRLRTNFNKLKSRGFLHDEVEFESFLSKPDKKLLLKESGQGIHYYNQIVSIVQRDEGAKKSLSGYLELKEDGRVVFFDSKNEKLFSSFVSGRAYEEELKLIF